MPRVTHLVDNNLIKTIPCSKDVSKMKCVMNATIAAKVEPIQALTEVPKTNLKQEFFSTTPW